MSRYTQAISHCAIMVAFFYLCGRHTAEGSRWALLLFMAAIPQAWTAIEHFGKANGGGQ